MSVAPSRSSVADEARRRAQPPPPPAATTGTPVTGSANQNGDGIALRGLPAGLTTNVRQPADRLTGRAVEDTSPTTGTGTSAEQAARAEKVAAAAATVDDRGRAGQALLGTAPARAAAPPLPPAPAGAARPAQLVGGDFAGDDRRTVAVVDDFDGQGELDVNGDYRQDLDHGELIANGLHAQGYNTLKVNMDPAARDVLGDFAAQVKDGSVDMKAGDVVNASWGANGDPSFAELFPAA